MGLFLDNEINSTNSSSKTETIQKHTTVKKKTITSQQEKKPKKIKFLEEDEPTNNLIIREIKELSSYKTIADNILSQFRNNKLHHATILSGNYGIGKSTLAYWLISKMILSQFNNEELKQSNLQLIRENNHPDIFILEKKQDENEIKIENVRLLLDRISIKSTYGNKFILIDDINSLNINSSNAILKTLEEPFNNTYFFLINHNTSPILDTIYSRCNEIKLHLHRKDFIEILSSSHKELKNEELEIYADISECSISFAEILIQLNIANINNISKENIKSILNQLVQKIEKDYKYKLSTTLKLSLIEKIMFYFIKKNNEHNTNMQDNALLANSLTKQLLDIKKFELPIFFV